MRRQDDEDGDVVTDIYDSWNEYRRHLAGDFEDSHVWAPSPDEIVKLRRELDWMKSQGFGTGMCHAVIAKRTIPIKDVERLVYEFEMNALDITLYYKFPKWDIYKEKESGEF